MPDLRLLLPDRHPGPSVRRAILTAAPEPWECWLGVFACLWGCWLANPWVATFGSAPGYAGMAAVQSEASWGLSFVVVGLTQLGGLARRNRGARLVGAWLAFMGWAYVAYNVGVANPLGTGFLAYGMIALAAAYLTLLLARPRWS